MSSLAPQPRFRVVGSDGLALVGGKVYTYIAGTSTPKATYTDSGLGTPNANPVILDSRGEADIWLDGAYKIIVNDSSDVLLPGHTIDNVRDLTNSATFTSPTLAGTPVVTATAVTWSGNPTHSGNHTWTGNHLFNGNTTIGDANTDSLTIHPNAVTWQNNPTHSGNHTWSGSHTFTTPSVGMSVCKVKTVTTSRASTTTVADDTHLVQALGVGTWAVSLFFSFWGTTSGAGGITAQFAFSGTQTAFAAAGSGRLLNATTSTAMVTVGGAFINAATIAVGTAPASPADWLQVSADIVVTVAGNLSMQWAQNSSNVNAANVGVGSHMVCTRVA